MEYVANTNVILKTKSRVRIEKKSDKNKDPLSINGHKDISEDASITVELFKDDDKIENNCNTNCIEGDSYRLEEEINSQLENEILGTSEDTNFEEESYNDEHEIDSQIENDMLDTNEISNCEEEYIDDEEINKLDDDIPIVENNKNNLELPRDGQVLSIQLINEIPNEEENQSSDDEGSITSSFAREILKEDIEIKTVTHMAKEVLGKPPPALRKKGVLPRHCVKCCKTFARPARYLKHLEVHKKNEKKLFQCLECFETFTGEQDHEHDNIRPLPNSVQRKRERKFECTICNKRFSTKVILNNHLTLHSNVKNFSCNYCPKTFYTNGSLTRHLHKHTGVKCRFCNGLFRAGNILETHERTHTGEKPYICELCGKTFALSSGLEYHIRRHNNDKRYECETCGKKFYTNSNLRKHSKTHIM
ncbi:zinc finger and SCAN domain-containing protein 2-like isoform X2 [Condylostylus longicornis]|nr:zinc finger and SCAN domain-containing protein 2-like isoform X2 [Condylostylus longicornis]